MKVFNDNVSVSRTTAQPPLLPGEEYNDVGQVVQPEHTSLLQFVPNEHGNQRTIQVDGFVNSLFERHDVVRDGELDVRREGVQYSLPGRFDPDGGGKHAFTLVPLLQWMDAKHGDGNAWVTRDEAARAMRSLDANGDGVLRDAEFDDLYASRRVRLERLSTGPDEADVHRRPGSYDELRIPAYGDERYVRPKSAFEQHERSEQRQLANQMLSRQGGLALLAGTAAATGVGLLARTLASNIPNTFVRTAIIAAASLWAGGATGAAVWHFTGQAGRSNPGAGTTESTTRTQG